MVNLPRRPHYTTVRPQTGYLTALLRQQLDLRGEGRLLYSSALHIRSEPAWDGF